MAIVKQGGESSGASTTVSFLPPALAKAAPYCKFVNVVLVGMPSQEGVEGNQATVLLENPSGNGVKDIQTLTDQVCISKAKRKLMYLFSDMLHS